MRILSHLKLSSWGLKLVIAGFALGIAADEYRHRYIACMEKASNYASEADLHRDSVGIFDQHIKEIQSRVDAGLEGHSQLEKLESEREKARRLVGRCEDMRSGFEHAARIHFAPTPEETMTDGEYYSLPIPHFKEFWHSFPDRSSLAKPAEAHETPARK